MKPSLYKLLLLLGVLLIIGALLFFWQAFNTNNQNIESPGSVEPPVQDYKNLTYIIENQPVKLINGYSESPAAPGSEQKVITKSFGVEDRGDINADGKDDIVFLLTQESGGTGVFYYATGATKITTGWQPLNVVFLGDRIAPQTIEINDGVISVNYADRKPGEPMTAQPSVGVTKYLKIENGILTEKSLVPTYGMPYMLAINQLAQFSDGLKVTLTKINDSRCKPGVQCVWAGELAATFSLSGSVIEKPPVIINLGTVNKESVTSGGYEFTLTDATETTATILVKNPSVATGKCYIGGCSSEVCSDHENIATVCSFVESSGCYKTAKCQRQTNGQCGWTQTAELKACLAQNQ